MLTRIRNAQLVLKKKISVKKSKKCIKVLSILEKEGFIENFSIYSSHEIIINLKYFKNQPVIRSIKTVSRPGQRFYVNWLSLWKLKKSLSLFIISTPKGIITDKQARRLKIGGEILCSVS
jgi:small subunit ribosomal protein S8